MLLRIEIQSLLDLREFSNLLRDICIRKNLGTFFLKGDLGAGKTTFVREFVQGLPGGSISEVSSPSFNLYNIYPTTPEVIHIDLYRCIDLEEEVLEYLSRDNIFIFVEWCEKLPSLFWPDEYILFNFNMLSNNKRILEIKTKGRTHEIIIKELDKKLKEQDLP